VVNIPNSGKITGRIKILSNNNIENLQLSVGKLQLPALPTFLTHDVLFLCI